jgi:hypothetical protein
MDPYERFYNLLKRDFFPLLRADGFKRSGNTCRRVKGDRIDVINVQGSRYGGKCCVNRCPTADGTSRPVRGSTSRKTRGFIRTFYQKPRE